MSSLTLQFGFSFQDLHTPSGLQKIDDQFCQYLKKSDADLYRVYEEARAQQLEESDLLIKVAPILEDFLACLFMIEEEVHALQRKHHELAPLYTCKRTFIQRQVAKKNTISLADTLEGRALRQQLESYFQGTFSDLTYGTYVLSWLQEAETFAQQLEVAKDYGIWAVFSKEGQCFHKESPLFHFPQKLDYNHLIPDEIMTHQREGFELTDSGLSRAEALDQTHYCVFCHERDKDSCSKGFHSKKEPYNIERNPLGRDLEGCPLDEKISEMMMLKSQGLSVAALGIVTVDNPLVAATGHRICNDCMAACLYQKQDPVAVPGVETQLLRDVLELPWGFEIYSLLTRWNPLRFSSPLPKESTGGRALVVGMGPAGFTLAHYLLQDGHTVVGVEGLKIEPLPQNLLHEPLKDSSILFEKLERRIVAGFGGVAEYGITVRWDKNFLKIIRLLLERRENFFLQGGVRFGSAITPKQAFERFDHIALCAGAGQPNLLPIKNALARGVRLASDFLMALQLTGAAKNSSLANLELRLPAVVVGGGLTAIDTATEALAYYPVQVEKFLQRYEALGSNLSILSLDQEQKHVADIWLEHANILRQERQKESPDILKHLKSWGGVTVVYRKTLQESPGYRLNHEEVFKALQEGIEFAGEVIPEAIEVDEFGHACGLQGRQEDQEIVVPARSIFIAAGTKPNVTLSKEYPDLFELEGLYYKTTGIDNFLISSHKDQSMSYFGDLHPTYKGNVVKAMASAKHGAPVISETLQKRSAPPQDFLTDIKSQLSATVRDVNRLTPTITEIIIHAPLAVRNFKPGQFYRLQNFESLAPYIKGTTLAMEGLALTGAWVDPVQDLIALVVLDMGGSSNVCRLLQKGEPVVLMGPTGEPSEIPQGETICLMGGGLGNAVLFSIGKAMSDAGNKVVYVAGYRNSQDVFYRSKIEEAADQVIWLSEEGAIDAGRPSDKFLQGNMIEGLETLDLKMFDRFLAIGSEGMMAAVKSYLLGENLKRDAKLIASINAPMQCMMKEICAQCLQRHVDPATGLESYVYTCATQDQNMRSVDFSHLRQRLRQNSLQEKMTALWIEKCMQELENKSP